MHGGKESAGFVEREPFAIPEAGYKTLRRREALAGFVRVVEPGTASCFKLGKGVDARASPCKNVYGRKFARIFLLDKL